VIGRYAVLAGRIRQDLAEIERTVQRAERAIGATHHGGSDRDLFVDSAALSLHDCYSGIERMCESIASTVDQSVPAAHDRHRELLHQMTVEVPGLRPGVMSRETIAALDEYRRFRHVVRNVYAFEFDPMRIEQLVVKLRPAFLRARAELEAFAVFLEGLAEES
jgi:ribonuclease HepT-like protein